MLKNNSNQNYSIRILNKPKDIIINLQLGTFIPLLPEFKSYVMKDLELFKAKALVLEEEMDTSEFGGDTYKIVGNVLIYDYDGKDILYFGFFGVFDHNTEKIRTLIDYLIQYAKDHGYQKIKGPINIPIVIFGWGFLVKGSQQGLHIRYPLNPPIYNELFHLKGFNAIIREVILSSPTIKVYPESIRKNVNGKKVPVDFSEFEYINPGRKGLMQLKYEFVDLLRRCLSDSATITPNPSNTYDDLVKFIHDFGAKWMMWILRHKLTKKLVGGGYVIPDIFDKDSKGNINGVNLETWVVDEEFRGKNLSIYQWAMTSLLSSDRHTPHNIKRGYAFVSEDNDPSKGALKKVGAKIVGKKEIFEFIIKNEVI